jgi:hypothetical protein
MSQQGVHKSMLTGPGGGGVPGAKTHRCTIGSSIFLLKTLVQTALQETAAGVRKVHFYFYFSSVNKHPNKNEGSCTQQHGVAKCM